MKTLVRTFALGSLLTLLTSPLLYAGDVSGSVSAGFFSHYMWRGQRLSHGVVVQPSATLSYHGVSANLWANCDTDPAKLTEADLTLSYVASFGPASVEAGYIYYGLIDGLDSQEVYGAVTLNTLLKPRLAAYFDVDAGKGAYLQASVGHSLPITPRIPLNLGASVGVVVENGYVGLNAAGEEFTGFYNGQLSVGTAVPLHERVSLEPILAVDFALGDEARDSIRAVSYDNESTHVWGGATLRISF